jgi:hypothetical protein
MIFRRLAALVCLAALATGCEAGGAPQPAARAPSSPASTTSATAPPSAFFVRGAYGKDGSASGYDTIAGLGFNTVDSGPFKDYLDALERRGLRGFVWLGQWDKKQCRWEHDDAWIRAHVAPIAGHPAIAGYYLADEPLVSACPGAPAAMSARSQLVKSLDPAHPTFIVVQVTDGQQQFLYAPWVGSVDVLAFDVYPCSTARAACDYGKIDAAVAAAERAGVPRYWGVIQAFQGDNYYRMPTAAEVGEQFDHWRRSRISGYLVYTWSYQGVSLDSYPDDQAALRAANSLPPP